MADSVAPPLRILPSVAGRRAEDGWKVWISANGMAFELDAARARDLARAIADMCDVIDGANSALAEVAP